MNDSFRYSYILDQNHFHQGVLPVVRSWSSAKLSYQAIFLSQTRTSKTCLLFGFSHWMKWTFADRFIFLFCKNYFRKFSMFWVLKSKQKQWKVALWPMELKYSVKVFFSWNRFDFDLDFVYFAPLEFSWISFLWFKRSTTQKT